MCDFLSLCGEGGELERRAVEGVEEVTKMSPLFTKLSMHERSNSSDLDRQNMTQPGSSSGCSAGWLVA